MSLGNNAIVTFKLYFSELLEPSACTTLETKHIRHSIGQKEIFLAYRLYKGKLTFMIFISRFIKWPFFPLLPWCRLGVRIVRHLCRCLNCLKIKKFKKKVCVVLPKVKVTSITN